MKFQLSMDHMLVPTQKCVQQVVFFGLALQMIKPDIAVHILISALMVCLWVRFLFKGKSVSKWP